MNARINECEYNEIGLWVVHPDTCSEIRLIGTELLKLEIQQPGAVVRCVGGALWLTQPGDSHDHIIRAGESFRLYQAGTVLVQGLPRGRALVIEAQKGTPS